MRVIILLLIFAVPLCAYQAKSTRTENSSTNHAQKRTNQTNTELNNPTTPTPQDASNRQPSKDPNQTIASDSTQDSPRWVNFLNAISTAIIAVFTAFLFIGLLVQIQTTRAIECAWILIRRIGNPPNDWLQTIESGYIPGIIFEFEIAGNTTARVTEARFTLRVLPARQGAYLLPDLPEIPNYGGIEPRPWFSGDGVMFPPNGTLQIPCTLEGYPITPAQRDELLNGTAILCGYGILKYKDAFRRSRETATCYVYDFSFGGVFRSPEGTILNPSGFRQGGPSRYNRAT